MFTLREAATHFEQAAARCRPELETLVATITTRAGFMARSYIGHEQEDWAPLSSATVEGFRHEAGFWVQGKRDLGYGGYESPLLRTGQLRDSIDIDLDGLVGVVGSDSKIALYMEMGTPFARYPMAAPDGAPRPIFSKAMMEAAGGVQELAEGIIVSLLVPKG